MVAMGVRNSCESEFNSVLYNLNSLSFSSLNLAFFSASRILNVSTAFTRAIKKYKRNISTSSALPISNVYKGGIKKKFQITALRTAASNTGKISNNIATTETVINNNSATIL